MSKRTHKWIKALASALMAVWLPACSGAGGSHSAIPALAVEASNAPAVATAGAHAASSAKSLGDPNLASLANPVTLGADPSGVNDSSAAFQAGINATCGLQIPNGTYDIRVGLTVPPVCKKLTILGTDRYNVTMKMDNSWTPAPGSSNWGGDNNETRALLSLHDYSGANAGPLQVLISRVGFDLTTYLQHGGSFTPPSTIVQGEPAIAIFQAEDSTSGMHTRPIVNSLFEHIRFNLANSPNGNNHIGMQLEGLGTLAPAVPSGNDKFVDVLSINGGGSLAFYANTPASATCNGVSDLAYHDFYVDQSENEINANGTSDDRVVFATAGSNAGICIVQNLSVRNLTMHEDSSITYANVNGVKLDVGGALGGTSGTFARGLTVDNIRMQYSPNVVYGTSSPGSPYISYGSGPCCNQYVQDVVLSHINVEGGSRIRAFYNPYNLQDDTYPRLLSMTHVSLARNIDPTAGIEVYDSNAPQPSDLVSISDFTVDTKVAARSAFPCGVMLTSGGKGQGASQTDIGAGVVKGYETGVCSNYLENGSTVVLGYTSIQDTGVGMVGIGGSAYSPGVNGVSNEARATVSMQQGTFQVPESVSSRI